jgi:hypothetical protein
MKELNEFIGSIVPVYILFSNASHIHYFLALLNQNDGWFISDSNSHKSNVFISILDTIEILTNKKKGLPAFDEFKTPVLVHLQQLKTKLD